MNVNIDAARLPAGLLVAAALVQWLPQYATGPGLLALAIGAFLTASLKLKGLAAGAGLVIAAVVFTQLTGIGSPGLRDLGNRAPVDVGGVADQIVEGVGR